VIDMGLCLIAVLGTGLLCSAGGDKQPVVVSDFCQITVTEIAKLQRLDDTEIAALKRPRKEAIVSLKRKYKKLCPPRQR
jgi:hypothetical protein